MWISRKKWNNLKAEIKSHEVLKESVDELLHTYRDRNEYLRKMLDAAIEQLLLTEKWMRTRDEVTGRFKKTEK